MNSNYIDKVNTVNKVINDLIKLNGIINVTKKQVCELSGIPEGSFMGLMQISFTDYLSGFNDNSNIAPVKTTSKRTNPKLRKVNILKNAVKLAKEKGYLNVTIQDVAKIEEISGSAISYYFNTVNQLRRDIVRFAVKHEILTIIAQALASKNPHVLKAPDELKKRAIELISKN